MKRANPLSGQQIGTLHALHRDGLQGDLVREQLLNFLEAARNLLLLEWARELRLESEA